jgi:hypothetical protein
MRRLRGAFRAYRIARGFNVGVVRAACLTLRYLLTGRTGRYRIGTDWRQHSSV